MEGQGIPGRQCAEAVWIRKVDSSKRINNKNEFHQPGDVQVIHEKNESEEKKLKKKLWEAKEKKGKANKPEETLEENQGQREGEGGAGEKNVGPSIIDFIRRMRENKEKENEKNKSDENKNGEFIEEENNFSTQNFINDARARRHKGVKTFQCDLCEFKSGSVTLMDRHRESIHKELGNTCNQCEHIAPSEVDLKVHIESSHDKQKNHRESTLQEKKTKSKYVKTRIQCNECDKKFNKKENFRKHTEKYHPGSVNSIEGDLPLDLQDGVQDIE